MSKPQDKKQSTTKQWIRRILSRKRQASPVSQHPDALDVRNTTTAIDIFSSSTSVSRPQALPVSPQSVIVNQPSTVPGPTGIDHNSPLLTGNKAPGNSTSYTMQGGASTHTSASFQASESLPSDGPPLITNYTGAVGVSCSPRIDLTTSHTAPSELPSQVEETFIICPRFRILLVGNSGVGKSSLVSSVFNISQLDSEDGPPIDISHNCAGEADIRREYYSEQNPRFIFHDSKGFEPGSTENSKVVKSFLRERSEGNAELPEQVHAIWLCIITPRTGSRYQQTADEELLELAKELNIPVIVVFTKFDLLFVEHFIACGHIASLPDKKVEALKRAENVFRDFTTEEVKIPFAPVSTKKEALKEYGGPMLVNLTKVTRVNLQNVEGPLWALWAAAQQINARQKVELSINEGLKRYWLKLSKSLDFEGKRLVDCIERIHDDILKVWNFYDPLKLLSGEEFLKRMIGLVEPLSGEVIRNQWADDVAVTSNVVSIAGVVSSSLVLPALGTIIGMVAFQFLKGIYRKGVSTAAYLAAYIVDLILVLYEISKVTMVLEPPKSLSREHVIDALAVYESESSRIHAQVKEIAVTLKLEEKIASVIWDAIGWQDS